MAGRDGVFGVNAEVSYKQGMRESLSIFAFGSRIVRAGVGKEKS